VKADILQITLERSIDQFAEVEHQRWAHWQQYMHSHCTRLDDGSLVIPPELAARWQTQIETPYHALTEREKESDRDQVRKYFPILGKILHDEPST
jgi:hypothetical protein